MSFNFWKPKNGKALKPSKVNPWKVSMKKPCKTFYGDSDGDGIMNMFDCEPHNKRKQGPEHTEEERNKSWKEFTTTGKIDEVDQRTAREITPRRFSRKQKIKGLVDFGGYSKKEAREMLEDMGE